LYYRTGPGTSYPYLGEYPYKTLVYIVCQESGELYGGNIWWDKLTTGYYMTDVYITTAKMGPPASGIPQC
jgi:hypothetical protein